jgi:hypothetical protein
MSTCFLDRAIILPKWKSVLFIARRYYQSEQLRCEVSIYGSIWTGYSLNICMHAHHALRHSERLPKINRTAVESGV